MASWLEKLFREHGVFKVPESARNLPTCRIRPYLKTDLEACERIYQLNEGGNFSGGIDNFRKTLDDGQSFYLVCEEDGVIRSLGGMCVYLHENGEFTNLFYGLVHPDHHRRGFGTAMLLTRLSLLPPPRDEWQIMMYSVADSFHRKFGFHPVNEAHDEHHNRMAHLLVHLSQIDIQRARAPLQAAGIRVECPPYSIPRHRPAPPVAEPDELSSEGPHIPPVPSLVNKTVSLAQAVFITVAAFCIFVVLAGICYWYYRYGP